MSANTDTRRKIIRSLKRHGIEPSCSENHMEVFYIHKADVANTFIELVLELLNPGVIGVDTETQVQIPVYLTHFRLAKILGVDSAHPLITEYKNADQRQDFLGNAPSTMQVCFGEGIVAVFNVVQMCFTRNGNRFDPSLFPDQLTRLMEDPNVIKSGVGIGKDVKEFSNWYPVFINNVFDLEKEAKTFGLGYTQLGLASLAYLYCLAELDKRKLIVFTRWDSVDISMEALSYAANDAYYSHLVYLQMEIHPAPRAQVSFEGLAEILRRNK